ncbi:MAG: ribosome recycling factor [Candidatus Cloacimonadota bacterium]|nr:ribosome recycling factor [Candidatus Cloacimonadota bacterium]
MDKMISNLEKEMKKTLDSLLHQFSKLRTGRASTSIIDSIKVDYYGQPTPIKQMCNISIPEARLIVIKPYDKTSLGDIEKALLAANLGITPANDGNVVRLPFQPLTEEKRKQIVQDMKGMVEDAKISARNHRRDANAETKKMQKASEISEDDEKLTLKEIQEITDNWTKKITDAGEDKEIEIMEV